MPPKEFERGDYREFTSSHLPMRRRGEHKNIFTITVEILVRYWSRTAINKVIDDKNDVSCNATVGNPRHVG